MRISDWSSYVCSSDLRGKPLAGSHRPYTPLSSRGLAPGPTGISTGRRPTTLASLPAAGMGPGNECRDDSLGVARANQLRGRTRDPAWHQFPGETASGKSTVEDQKTGV